MQVLLRFLLLVVLLNLVRYFIGGPIESITIMEPMHRVMPEYPACFNNTFTTSDWSSSFFYNFMVWLSVTLMFHLAHPALRGGWLRKSMLIFGVGCLFFVSLAAVYMNHYTSEIRTFYLWSMMDALILFPLLGVANAWLYPRVMRVDELTGDG